MKHHHDLSDRQRGFARYLLTLDFSQRNFLLAKMRPVTREKMRAFVLQERARDIQSWDNQVRKMYLARLRIGCPKEYSALMDLLPVDIRAGYEVELNIH